MMDNQPISNSSSSPAAPAGFNTAVGNNPVGFSPSKPSGPGPTVFTPSPAKKTKLTGKNLVLGGVLLLILTGLVFGFDKARSFLSQAESDCTPENLSEANLTPNSVEITFQTGKTCQAEVAYGTSSESLLLRIPEATASLNHRVRLAPLLPSTTYYYQVVSEGKKVGTVRSFLTKSTQAAVTPTATLAPTRVPTVPPATPSAYTAEDFQKQMGASNASFDIDKNGIVNTRDWLLYQEKK